MNYIKPEDIKAYVEQNPQGIAGMSEELATMVNHFTKLIVKECIDCLKPLSRNHSMVGAAQDTIKEHFGVEE